MLPSAAQIHSASTINLLGLDLTPVAFWVLICFVLVLAGCFTWFGYSLRRGQKKARRRIRQLETILSPLSDENLVAMRESALDTARALRESSRAAPEAWMEFDESLVESPDRRRLFNTVDAEYFFDTETLAGELLHNRIQKFLPSALTALGVLGTFVGLVAGLWGLDLGSDADSTELRSGVGDLISGASLAFVTSILGVSLSLAANMWGNHVANQVSQDVKKIQERIDHLFSRHTAERSLIEIERNSVDSNTALQELHEKIGVELQRAVTGLSQDMQAAVTAALESSVTPAMAQISESASKQSSEVFEHLVGKFASSFEDIGNRQAQQMGEAATSVGESLGAMSGEFSTMMERLSSKVDGIMEKTGEQSEAAQKRLEELMLAMSQQRTHTEEVVAMLAETVDAAGLTMKTSSQHLQSASRDLEKSANAFTDASSTIGERTMASAELLDSSTEKLVQTVDRQQGIADTFAQHHEQLERLHGHLQEAGQSLTEAAATSRDGFTALEQHQTSYLKGLHTEFEELTNGLSTRLEATQDSMRQWLNEYSTAVSEHTQKRFEEWNSQSQAYASKMLNIAGGLQDTLEEIDELKGRVKSGVHTA